jgi:hypothetical protein
MVVLAFVLIVLSGASEGIMDVLDHAFHRSIFKKLNPQWWNPEVSWENKWKGKNLTKERFLGSATIFVFVTDAWHLFKALRSTLLWATVGCMMYGNMSLWYIPLIVLSNRAAFEISYRLYKL